MARFGFCFTYNYKDEGGSEADIHNKYNELKGAVGRTGITYIIYAKERGDDTNRLHLQGYLQSNQKNKSRIYDKFGICIKPQKHTATAAANYCKKDGDFFEAGTFDATVKGRFEKSQGKRSDLDSVKEAIERGESYDDICKTHFGEAAKFGRFIKERIQARDTQKELDSLRSEYENASLRPWQQAVVDIVEEDPNPRAIHWIWEARGNTGKSWMTKYLAAMHNACILTAGKKTDMAYIYSKNPSKVVVFDLSRTTEPAEGREHFLDGTYSLAEDLKNGLITSTKYDSTTVLTRGCHVIFFANFPPDMTKWSADRYMVTEI